MVCIWQQFKPTLLIFLISIGQIFIVVKAKYCEMILPSGHTDQPAKKFPNLNDNFRGRRLEPQLRRQRDRLDVREVILAVEVAVLAVAHGCNEQSDCRFTTGTASNPPKISPITICNNNNRKLFKGGSPGLVVMGGDSCP